MRSQQDTPGGTFVYPHYQAINDSFNRMKFSIDKLMNGNIQLQKSDGCIVYVT